MLTKGLFIRKLDEFIQEHKEYSIGECLYSMLRRETLKSKPNGVDTSWLMDISDRDMYGAIEHAIEIEK